jgi:heat shock protein HtpX
MDPIYKNIATNKMWTFVFFSVYVMIFCMIGYAIAMSDHLPPINGITTGFVGFLFVLLVCYYNSEEVVIAMSSAKEVSKQKEPYLYNIVESLSITADIPIPKLYVIDTDVPNAFAAGRNPKNASITVTTDLIKKLDRFELEGVIAHEIAHIRDRDILIATIAVVLAGTIVFVGFMARQYVVKGFKLSNKNLWTLLVLAILFSVLIFIAPLFSKLLKLAIARKREFLADATSADLTRYPEGLTSALEKISTMQKSDTEIAYTALNEICIINPAIEDDNGSIFATHPPTEERIKRLREIEFIDQKTNKHL